MIKNFRAREVMQLHTRAIDSLVASLIGYTFKIFKLQKDFNKRFGHSDT